ncbi:uncharacterized protein K460DRAFT_55871 [Cucurbitaria berberidis CBS 394.84]|uniref:Heterokaryon incompatibility domain-containing protein n=1 Tax=Cucurbitaria berberidis CBS 394.84 TaxID=1168544 RepID=A0A9P4L9P6_9PLEO|nr:uncharacterized protein K460DRAFT_55871 [Cucurbitaria berberidis CBS 394.84]KAF1847250.1 hypothetical protein K460DRAFT_55871 [Cucurbitaria berberidis CBS 394.84]
MDLPSYRYEPLTPKTPAIRLLDVLPSKPGELCCQLNEVFLDQNPKFTTVSYCWGATKRTIPTTFLCENGKHAQLNITPNLQSFLLQFIINHPDHGTRPMLWVDAASINQDDNEERSAQVAMMQDIYHKAERVIAWLGEGTLQSDAGMAFIPQLVAAEQRAKMLDGTLSSISTWRRLRMLGLPKEGNDDKYEAFVSLFKREWFSRVWIIQEVAMAKEVQLTCGSQSASWDDFVKAYFFMNTLNLIMPDPAGSTPSLIRVHGVILSRESRVLHHTRDLLGILLRSRSSLATDPRDKIFALLGLATNTGPDAMNFRADYTLDVQQVYTDLVLAIIGFEQNLDILGVPRKANTSPPETWPSWVPDWSTWDTTSMLNCRERHASYAANDEILVRNAAGDTRAAPQVSSDKRLLGLEGNVFDEVTNVGAIYESDDKLLDFNVWLIAFFKFWKDCTKALLHWESISEARSGKLYPPTGETMLDAYWQTITGGWQVGGHELSSSTYVKWDSYHRPAASLRRLVGRSIATTSAYGWLTVGLCVCKQMYRPIPELGFDFTLATNRRFIRSKKGFMGLVPAETRSGDKIALFKGGGSPLIIRAHGENWELVGDSYVHGMMNAECFREDECHTMWLA